MLTIDAQVHAYERNHPGRPWHAVLTRPREVTGDQMVAAVALEPDRGRSPDGAPWAPSGEATQWLHKRNLGHGVAWFQLAREAPPLFGAGLKSAPTLP